MGAGRRALCAHPTGSCVQAPQGQAQAGAERAVAVPSPRLCCGRITPGSGPGMVGPGPPRVWAGAVRASTSSPQAPGRVAPRAVSGMGRPPCLPPRTLWRTRRSAPRGQGPRGREGRGPGRCRGFSPVSCSFPCRGASPTARGQQLGPEGWLEAGRCSRARRGWSRSQRCGWGRFISAPVSPEMPAKVSQGPAPRPVGGAEEGAGLDSRAAWWPIWSIHPSEKAGNPAPHSVPPPPGLADEIIPAALHSATT